MYIVIEKDTGRILRDIAEGIGIDKHGQFETELSILNDNEQLLYISEESPFYKVLRVLKADLDKYKVELESGNVVAVKI